MVSRSQLRAAERDMLALLQEGGLQMPDRIEYGEACVWFFWTPQKLVVAFDVDDVSEPGTAARGPSA